MNHQKPIYSIPELADKWQRGTITTEEKAHYEQWYASFNDEELFVENPTAEHQEQLAARLYTKVMHRIDRDERKPQKMNSWSKWYSIAAVLVLMLTGLLVFNRLSGPAPVISPGKNTAILKLSDGKVITLSDRKNGVVIDAAKLTYNDGTNLNEADVHSDPNTKMTVSTPRGGTYQVSLPDGSKVWLNAASSLTFPSSFDGLTNRKVELKGEAYFEVEKSYGMTKGHAQRRAFIVVANNQEIEVLGTHFNVKNYADEPGVRTTLLEGSVKVMTGSDHIIIAPGQQTFSNGKGIEVFRVNVSDAVAWKNGNFQFNDENIENVMRAISRWYDVDIEYQGTITKEKFGGTISRSKPISEVLASLEETGYVKFKIEGRRVMIMP
ncbi:fec operon regulator FecR [compost metagenome]